MTDAHREMTLDRIPVTVYKEDPAHATAPAEWHEVWTATNTAEEWVLCERHGWWDEAKRQAYFNVPILSEPFKTGNQVDDAFHARIRQLDSEGWIHKLTTTIDYREGRIHHHRYEMK
jgi:hypothetical protein